MHLGKSKVMFNSYAKASPFNIDGKTFEEVDSYLYPGKKIV